ncbi:AAA family ATPase [Ketobacter sp. MCCC 1A13808]|uniref:ParA family protein n=1 Tax=Ketobacter sp. MCCC 1A13808 TaxID=2602738 RepID=UPI000F2117AE|nr:AAA family ATPase [Ketobacter sp. MCCC 1A13808]MVF12043.1 AAA family ATPase [Ketobacter sp. MCCC 1A13808]RLP52371.1 MAG: ParA family protein [Ketobacter sp.]
MKVIACYSFKGGVGKTSTAINMAWFAADSGQRTLLIDLDPQGASTYCFRIKSKKQDWSDQFFSNHKTLVKHIKGSDFDNLDLVPAQLSFRQFDIALSDMKKADKRLRRLLRSLRPYYDCIILDCPPSISLLSENVFNAADMVLVPVIPNALSERPLYQLYDFFDSKDIPVKRIMPFFSMVQAQKRVHIDAMQRIKANRPKMLKSRIPFSSDVEKMSEYRAPIAEFAASKPVFSHYNNLWSEVRQKLKV